MEPRLKWNKIILAAKIILFNFRGGSMLKQKTLKFFKIILFWHVTTALRPHVSVRPSVRHKSVFYKNRQKHHHIINSAW